MLKRCLYYAVAWQLGLLIFFASPKQREGWACRQQSQAWGRKNKLSSTSPPPLTWERTPALKFPVGLPGNPGQNCCIHERVSSWRCNMLPTMFNVYGKQNIHLIFNVYGTKVIGIVKALLGLKQGVKISSIQQIKKNGGRILFRLCLWVRGWW